MMGQVWCFFSFKSGQLSHAEAAVDNAKAASTKDVVKAGTWHSVIEQSGIFKDSSCAEIRWNQ